MSRTETAAIEYEAFIGETMRSALLLAVGIAIGGSAQLALGQQRELTSLNHVAIAVENFDAAATFYRDVMGFKEAFAFKEPDGRPTLSYFQISRNTFIELMLVTPTRPAGFVHVGLEVTDVDAAVKRWRAAGMTVGDAVVSPRTKARVAVGTASQGTGVELLEFGPDSLTRKVIDSWK